MATKLTLTIDKPVVDEAKKYAKSHGRSLSHLIEEYLKFIIRQDRPFEETELSPITQSLYGSVKLKKKNIDYNEIIEDEILKKHLGTYSLEKSDRNKEPSSSEL